MQRNSPKQCPIVLLLKDTVTDMSDLSGTNKSSVGKKSKVGRPCGTTNLSKESSELLLVEEKNEISKRFAAVQKSTKKGNVFQRIVWRI
jgi:hypothetical protein